MSYYFRTQFVLGGKVFSYFDHPSNNTATNERRVEVALLRRYLFSLAGPFLEVGNVSRHYERQLSHDVWDLHEQLPWPNLHNYDVLLQEPQSGYQTILSISTVEHTADPATALQRLLSWSPNACVTVPVGYRPNGVDSSDLADVKTAADCVRFMKRVNAENHWVETTREDAMQCEYDKPYRCANAIIIWLKGLCVAL